MAAELTSNDLQFGDKHVLTYLTYGSEVSVDLDALSIGFVRCAVDASHSPTGSATFAGVLTLECGTKTQFFIPAKQYNVWMRYYGGSSWSAWRQLSI